MESRWLVPLAKLIQRMRPDMKEWPWVILRMTKIAEQVGIQVSPSGAMGFFEGDQYVSDIIGMFGSKRSAETWIEQHGNEEEAVYAPLQITPSANVVTEAEIRAIHAEHEGL